MKYDPLESVRQLLVQVGEDPDREGLRETPDRYCQALQFWTSGYGKDPKAVLKSFADGAESYDAMVFQANIPTYSLCEHHMAPFFGLTHIAYIPLGRVVGLSKLARLVDIYARRLQVQERLCTQVADTLMNELNAEGVGVVMQCRHLCMESRGVQKPGTITVTSSLRGSIKDEATVRAEFMSLVNTSIQKISTL